MLGVWFLIKLSISRHYKQSNNIIELFWEYQETWYFIHLLGLRARASWIGAWAPTKPAMQTDLRFRSPFIFTWQRVKVSESLITWSDMQDRIWYIYMIQAKHICATLPLTIPRAWFWLIQIWRHLVLTNNVSCVFPLWRVTSIMDMQVLDWVHTICLIGLKTDPSGWWTGFVTVDSSFVATLPPILYSGALIKSLQISSPTRRIGM